MSIRVAFVGAGKMVSAIVKSLLRSEIFDPNEIACCSAQDGTSEKLSEETGILRFDKIEGMLDAGTDLLVLGCKPQQLAQLPDSISESTQGTLILSIMAGITLDRLGSVFPNEFEIRLVCGLCKKKASGSRADLPRGIGHGPNDVSCIRENRAQSVQSDPGHAGKDKSTLG